MNNIYHRRNFPINLTKKTSWTHSSRHIWVRNIGVPLDWLIVSLHHMILFCIAIWRDVQSAENELQSA